MQVSERTVVAGLRLLRPVGAGGEGEVWEARDAAGRPRAVKLIPPGSLVDPETVRRRARWLRRIDHPALVRVHRSGLLSRPWAGWGFVEMDYIDGVALEELPADPLMLDRLAEVAAGLDLLHAGAWSGGTPLVHRDIKPANLVETRGGRLVLVDPSTLRRLDGRALTRIGTPVFAAPEVLGGRISPAADVYALGVTVMALRTGARGDALAGLVADPQAVDVPEGARAAVAPDPADRPRSCRAVLEDRPAVLVGARPRTRVWPWLAWLGVVTAVAGFGAWTADALWLAGAVGLHLIGHVAAGRRLLPAALVPPVAWALLLGRRAGLPRRQRGWQALSTGLLAVAAALGVGAAVSIEAAIAVWLAGGWWWYVWQRRRA